MATSNGHYLYTMQFSLSFLGYTSMSRTISDGSYLRGSVHMSHVFVSQPFEPADESEPPRGKAAAII